MPSVGEVCRPRVRGSPRRGSIITTRANELVAPIHDRMPVILPPEAEADWLDPNLGAEHAMALLDPYPAGRMLMRPASPLVNSVGNDGPELLAPAADTALF